MGIYTGEEGSLENRESEIWCKQREPLGVFASFPLNMGHEGYREENDAFKTDPPHLCVEH